MLIPKTPHSTAIDEISLRIKDEIDRHDQVVNKFMLHIERVSEFLNNSSSPLTDLIVATASEEELAEKKAMIKRCANVYTALELIAKNEARSFSNHSRALLRKAQADVQHVRLWLDSSIKGKVVSTAE